MRKLNLRYRSESQPTDVLSFDISKTKDSVLADIVVSTDMALSNARIFKTSSLYELYLYVIHGLLHILGYDDRTGKQRKLMESKEKGILEKICQSIKLKP